MIKRAAMAFAMMIVIAQTYAQTSTNDQQGVRDFIARWNAAYTSLDSATLAQMETADYELIDRFGHWIRTEGPEFNERLWALTFKDIYHGKPGPARNIESIRFMGPTVAVVEARAYRPDGVLLDDGNRIPPFWEIDTYTLVKTEGGWRVALLNIHNQITPGTEGAGAHVPDASAAGMNRK
jgi:ketosteroid isomerase-like protein